MLSNLQKLLTDLAHTPAVICTVGWTNAIGELFLKQAPEQIVFSGVWAAVECKGWHLHVNLAEVACVRFTEETGYNNSVSPVAIFEDNQGKAVMRFYFPHASHTHSTYTAEELALFGRFKERYQKGQEAED